MHGFTRLFAIAAAGLALAVVGSLTVPRILDEVGAPKPLVEVGARYSIASLGLRSPVAMAVAPNGNLYVTEAINRVTEIEPSGQVLRRWGSTGSGPGQFQFTGVQADNGAYAAIAVGPNGRVYVSDSANHRVQVFEEDGTYVRAFGSAGTGPGQFGLAWDLTVDGDGNVYVLDDILEHLTKFDPNGQVVWIANRTTNPALQGHGHGVHLDNEGHLVYANDDNGDVIFLDVDGHFVEAFSAEANGVSSDPSGNLYVCGCEAADLRIFDAAHRLVATAPQFVLRGPPAFGPGGSGFGLDAEGNVIALRFNLPAR